MEKKIILIEPNPDHADLIIDTLEKENLKSIKKEVILKKNGQEAIDYFQKINSSHNIGIQSQIDFVILDLNLPEVNGMEVLKFIKNNQRYYKIPVIIYSTSTDSNIIDEAYRNGANAYMTKPVSKEEFVERVKTLKKYCTYYKDPEKYCTY